MKKLDIISYLRGFSIFTIVLMHLMMMIELPSFLGKAIMLGGAGVHVFFLCSGFGLYLSHLRKSLAFGPFIRKRLMKVYWPYVFVVLLWAAWITFKSGVFPVLELSSHVFLWKMFSVKMDTSLCYPYWFVSTIIQFYLVWPVLVRLIRCKYGLGISCAVSLSWTTAVGALGLDDMRPWGSFFFQYLWEFCLGMYLANKCYNWKKGSDGILPVWLNVQKMPWLLLIMGVSLGMGLNGVMTIKGGWLKMYNDVPSLVGYLSCALLLYKGLKSWIANIFVRIDGFSYELYLVHTLIYEILFFFLNKSMPVFAFVLVNLVSAFFVAYIYSYILKVIKVK